MGKAAVSRPFGGRVGVKGTAVGSVVDIICAGDKHPASRLKLM
ncbi:MAG: hypothetical protein PVI86_08270 [Phycisphaerae bacterium]|jgi:hypothetical protein